MSVVFEHTSYGFRCTIVDPLSYEEAVAWLDEICRIAQAYRDKQVRFGQLMDLRGRSGRLQPAQQELIAKSMRFVRECGLMRSAVIVQDSVFALKIKQSAFETGMYEWERYLSTSSTPDWERKAVAWIEDGIDPDV